jgi:hypothetical protein
MGDELTLVFEIIKKAPNLKRSSERYAGCGGT